MQSVWLRLMQRLLLLQPAILSDCASHVTVNILPQRCKVKSTNCFTFLVEHSSASRDTWSLTYM